ncbi:MAG: conjugal transfer protein TraX, partial [Clostridia bacterium]|nr:conjugal transfer protein TraX [Clostridia bacterium]
MEKLRNRQKGLNSNALKLIAIAAMTVDHFTWAVFPGTQSVWYVIALHIIGRLTAPIMWFFIAEGCRKTHDIKKYALRMLIFAVVSHFAYCFAFGIPLSVTHGGFFNRTSV